jgi:hypothetical protein
MVILLVATGCFFIGAIGGYKWLLIVILLMIINCYFIGGY